LADLGHIFGGFPRRLTRVLVGFLQDLREVGRGRGRGREKGFLIGFLIGFLEDSLGSSPDKETPLGVWPISSLEDS